MKAKLEEDELNWLSYESSCYLIFKSNTGELDTLEIIGKRIWHPSHNFPESHGIYTPEIGVINYSHSSLMRESEELLRVTKKTPNKKAKVNIYIFNSMFTSKLSEINKIERYDFRDSKLNDCFQAISIAAHDRESDEINEVIWSKSLGLIKYATKGGISWRLHKVELKNE